MGTNQVGIGAAGREPATARVAGAQAGGRWRRLERWLWTGPVGHLIGGALDVIEANARYARTRRRRARR